MEEADLNAEQEQEQKPPEESVEKPAAEIAPTVAEMPEQKTTPQQNSSNSKLEALSHEELIKLVKRQLLNQKETKKQLEAAKREAEESRKHAKELATKLAEQQNKANDGSGGESATSMMAIELNDYKNAIGVVRKELQECKEQLAQRDSLVEELSQRIDQLQQGKEEVNEELRKKLAEVTEMHQEMEEKTKVIGENAKEISGLHIQLNESRQGMQEEIAALQDELRRQGQQLAAERRNEMAKAAELRRLKCENETFSERTAALKEEFSRYKERAEFALKSSRMEAANTDQRLEKSSMGNDENANGTSSPSRVSSKSLGIGEEVSQLVDLLRQRNAEISQLTAKCSFLEEEVRSGQNHGKTLLDELNALHDSIGQIRRQAQMDRQRIGQEYEQRLKADETKRGQLERELSGAREREMHTKMETAQNEMKMRLELERMAKQLEEAQRKAQKTANEEKAAPPSPAHQKPRPSSRKMMKIPPPLNLVTTQNPQPPMTTSSYSLEAPEEEAAGMNSESSDSLEDLQTILQEAQITPISDVPTFNVASLVDDDSIVAPHGSSPLLNEEQFHELQKQLADSRDLLSESEENNVRLSEQVNVLKEEIRRLERNQKRAQQLGNGLCSEYFKNIVLKFLAPPKVNDERAQLLPVLQTILHLDDRELELVRKSCAASAAIFQQQSAQSTSSSLGQQNEGVAETGGTGNGASLMDWSSLFGWKLK